MDGLGITLSHLEGGWAMGQLTMNADKVQDALDGIVSALRSFEGQS